jgi:response regulator of citrate/malate metabolism
LGLAGGASDYFVKPIDRDRLAVALNRFRAGSDSQDTDMMLAASGGSH